MADDALRSYVTPSTIVCYIIPVYNNQSGLDRTIKSIYEQDGLARKVIVYDDGTPSPIRVNSDSNLNIELIRGDTNNGIGFALNILLATAADQGYEYAALIDAGDVIINGRSKKQIDAFRKNQSAIVLGGSMVIADIAGAIAGKFDAPTGAKSIKKAFAKGYPFAHPTAMFRLRKLMETKIQYSENFAAAVDYDFLYRVYKLDPGNITNITDDLVIYVRETNSIGIKKASKQAREALRIRIRHNSLTEIDGLLGIIDPRLVLRALSPRFLLWARFIYTRISAFLQK